MSFVLKFLLKMPLGFLLFLTLAFAFIGSSASSDNDVQLLIIPFIIVIILYLLRGFLFFLGPAFSKELKKISDAHLRAKHEDNIRRKELEAAKEKQERDDIEKKRIQEEIINEKLQRNVYEEFKKIPKMDEKLINYLIDNYTVDSLQNCLQKDISIQGVGKTLSSAILKAIYKARKRLIDDKK